MRRIGAILLGLLTQVAGSQAADSQPVVCEGTYPHHLQGVCLDDQESIFWSYTTRLVKTDGSGRLLTQADVANHHGDLCFQKGRVYVAVNLGRFNDPQGNADSWVYVYDARDLQLVAKHHTPEVFHGAGGIAVHEEKFLVVGGLPDGVPENYVYEYDSDFRFVKKHTLASGHTNLGIQTAAFADGQWWFGCYGKGKSEAGPALPAALLRVDAPLKHVERIDFDCALGLLSLGEGRFLVARGGSAAGKDHTGRLLPAVPDRDRGLKLLEN